MSAYTVAPAHLSALVNAWISLGCMAPSFEVARNGEHHMIRADDADSWQRIWSLLAVENAVSVASRYNEEPSPCLGNHRSGPSLPPVAVLKALACYEYQSCEHEGWADSIAAKFVAHVRAGMIARLPGFEEADWSIV